ncbi:MAG: hypothetical protein ABEJ36_05230 [Candidatus Nanosalina sp.]
MEFSRKGQVQAVTVILLTGLTIGVASMVYVWGEPILNKREASVNLNSIERKVLTLRSELVRVSRSQGASSTVNMDIQDSQYSIKMIKVNESSEFIDIVVEARRSPYPEGRWTLLKGQTLQNLSIASGDYAIAGQDKKSVLMVYPGASVIRYRIEFRNMFSETRQPPLSIVDLNSTGGSLATGNAEIYMEKVRTVVEKGSEGLTLSSGQTLNRERTVIQIQFR